MLKRKKRPSQIYFETATSLSSDIGLLDLAGYFEKARENYPFLEKDDIAVYRVNEGKIISLMATDNDTGEYVINALDMSDTMERIFEEYESMEE